MNNETHSKLRMITYCFLKVFHLLGRPHLEYCLQRLARVINVNSSRFQKNIFYHPTKFSYKSYVLIFACRPATYYSLVEADCTS